VYERGEPGAGCVRFETGEKKQRAEKDRETMRPCAGAGSGSVAL